MYISAKYMSSDPLTLPDAPKPVQATDEQGQNWALTEDSQHGDWLRYIEEGGTIDPADPPVITSWDVNAERDKRITGGIEYMGYTFQSNEFSQRNMMDASQSAEAAIATDPTLAETYRWQSGATEDYRWITADNQYVLMNAYDVRGLAQMMIRWKQRQIVNGRVLKDMDPIPLDYKDDQYWLFEPPPPVEGTSIVAFDASS